MSANLELGLANIVEHSVSYSSLSGKQVSRLLKFNVLSALEQVEIQGAVGAGGRAPDAAGGGGPMCPCRGDAEKEV